MILYHTSLRAPRNESDDSQRAARAASYLEWDVVLSQITYFT